MRSTGFEPVQALSYWSLNPARLTTPATPHQSTQSRNIYKCIFLLNNMKHKGKRVQKRKTKSNLFGLEQVLILLTIVSILISFLFISNNLTGNTIISSTNSENSMFIGIVLFVAGLFGFLLLRKKD